MAAGAGGSTTPVVTLFESFGSGAEYIGPRVAAALGVHFHAGAFSSQEIEDAMTRREAEGVLSRVFGAMGGTYAAYAGLEGGSAPDAQRDNYELIMENTREVIESARQGGVIMGRNGALILADWPAALHVKLDGPLQERLERVAKTSGISLELAASARSGKTESAPTFRSSSTVGTRRSSITTTCSSTPGSWTWTRASTSSSPPPRSGPGPGLPRRRSRTPAVTPPGLAPRDPRRVPCGARP